MPDNIPSPDQSEFVYEFAEKEANRPGIDTRVKSYLLDYAAVRLGRIPLLEELLIDQHTQERKKSFLVIKRAGVYTHSDGQRHIMYWFRVRDMPESSKSFQKVLRRPGPSQGLTDLLQSQCILSYISDSHL